MDDDDDDVLLNTNDTVGASYRAVTLTPSVLRPICARDLLHLQVV